MRREFTLVLLLGAVGAGLVVLAVRQPWAHAIFVAPRPLPVQDFSVTGQELVPLTTALALAALACLAAVIATKSVTRRAAGALLAILGAGTAAAATAGVRASTVIAAAQANASNGAVGGSTTSGTSPGDATHAIVIAGSSGHAVMAGAPWRAVAVVGAVAIILAGLATIMRGTRWPVMSARFDRTPPGGSPGGRGGMDRPPPPPPPPPRGGGGGGPPPPPRQHQFGDHVGVAEPGRRSDGRGRRGRGGPSRPYGLTRWRDPYLTPGPRTRTALRTRTGPCLCSWLSTSPKSPRCRLATCAGTGCGSGW
jgi:uncharacterized membrane protein (TIGR02234 family)